jgi:hypothetical protein
MGKDLEIESQISICLLSVDSPIEGAFIIWWLVCLMDNYFAPFDLSFVTFGHFVSLVMMPFILCSSPWVLRRYAAYLSIFKIGIG